MDDHLSASLSDPLYVEEIVKQLKADGDHEKISALINLLTTEFTSSPDPNRKKGGLIGLAATTVGLGSEASHYLQQIVPPVMTSMSNLNSRVRYYGCEALYNIAKVARKDYIIYLEQSFDALSTLSADSDPNVQSAAQLVDWLLKDIEVS